MVYDPGITPRRTKLPSKSLWSLAEHFQMRIRDLSALGQPSRQQTGCLSPRFANPSTVTTPSTKNTAKLRDAPGVTLRVVSGDFDSRRRSSDYGISLGRRKKKKKRGLHICPAGRSSNVASPATSTGFQATVLPPRILQCQVELLREGLLPRHLHRQFDPGGRFAAGSIQFLDILDQIHLTGLLELARLRFLQTGPSIFPRATPVTS